MTTATTTSSIGFVRPYAWRSELTGIVMLGFVGLGLAVIAPFLASDTPLVHLDQGRLHAGVGFLLAASAFLILGAKLRALVSLLAGVALLASLALFLSRASADPTPQRGADLSLISFNILGINPRGSEIADYFIEQAPDVVFILEAVAIHSERERLAAAFPYNAGCGAGDRCDMAVFSPYPLSQIEVLPFFGINGRLIKAQITLPNGSATLVAAHFTKPYYGAAHERQLNRIAELMETIEGPVVLAGDFNSQPFVQAFRQALIERSGLQLASAMQPTWPALASMTLSWAGFAIDHVLLRGPISPVSVDLIEPTIGSNHRGFFSRFDLDGR